MCVTFIKATFKAAFQQPFLLCESQTGSLRVSRRFTGGFRLLLGRFHMVPAEEEQQSADSEQHEHCLLYTSRCV